MIDPRNHKISICGLQGSGKTYFSKEMVKRNNMRVLVYSPHWKDFEHEPEKNFLFYSPFSVDPKQVEKFLDYAMRLCKEGHIDGVFMDEFDMVYQSNFMIGTTATDIFSNHRHYNMSIIMITRRPQDIPAKVFESSKHIICFPLQGQNVQKKFNGLYKGMGDEILNLEYETWKYIHKEIGQPPKLKPPV